jgi:hydrogenase large subunit
LGDSGVIVDGELVTTKLQNINLGFEEFVDHSFYEAWSGHRFKTDPLDAPSARSTLEQGNQTTAAGAKLAGKYTWSTSPRWDRQFMDAECTARMWTTAMAQKLPENPYILPTGNSLRMVLPAGRLPEMELEWHIPDEWNAFERNRGRAYCVAYTALVALNIWQQGMDLMKSGQTAVSTQFEIPRRACSAESDFGVPDADS